MGCGNIIIDKEESRIDVINGGGIKVSSIPTQTYTVKCSDIQYINGSSVYDALKNIGIGATVRMNTDGSISFEGMNAEPKKPEKPVEEKEKEDMQRVTIPMPTKILKNGRATVVFFADDTKVVVKLPEGVEDNDYNAFCAAITKKMFGTNTRIKRKMELITEIAQTPEEKKEAIQQAKLEAANKRQAEIDKKVERMAHEMVLEKRAKQLARAMMEGDV